MADLLLGVGYDLGLDHRLDSRLEPRLYHELYSRLESRHDYRLDSRRLDFERISWDDALDGIAEGLTKVKEEYAPESIAGYHGTGPRQASVSTTLIPHALGSPNVISTDLHICYACQK